MKDRSSKPRSEAREDRWREQAARGGEVVVIGLYTRWFHRWALLAGWVVGMVVGSVMTYSVQYESVFTLELFGMSVSGYHAFFALLLNFAVALVLTPLCNAAKLGRGHDETATEDYEEFVEPAPFG